jgi:molybdopterin synthase sulfur carrier subunit
LSKVRLQQIIQDVNGSNWYYVVFFHFSNNSLTCISLGLKRDMNINILAFGIVREIFGGAAINTELPENATVGDLKGSLEGKYPRLKQLSSYLIAQDNQYLNIEDHLYTDNEIAIIPPVSGG